MSFVLVALRNILFSALGERVLARAVFGTAKYLAKRSDTLIDDNIVAEWESAYYNKSDADADTTG